MIRRLLKLLGDMDAEHEHQSERDGVLSYAGEWHGLALGFYYGFIDFRDWDGLPENYAEGRNVERGWYPKAGYVMGATLRVCIYLVLGGVFLGGLF